MAVVRTFRQVCICSAIAAALGCSKAAVADDRLQECIAIEEAPARLACYDRVAGRAERESSATTPAAGLPPSPPVARSSVADFGLDEAQKRANDPTGVYREPESISGVVKSVSGDPRGLFVIVLEGGQVWTQTEMVAVRRPRPGETVTIRRAAMGSYSLRAEHAPATRVRRLK
jgi:hypothetical protein